MGSFMSKDGQHRTTPASLPMLYDVYDCTLGMIEELEKHEKHGKKAPVNQEKLIQDVIELNLECLQHQMKSLPSEVTHAAKKDLVEQTVGWAASREAKDTPYGDVDNYCKNILEILLFGEPKGLPSVDGAPKIKITTEKVDGALYQMAVQRHLGKKQDEKFHQDSTKKTELRTKRKIEDLRQGALRLAKDDIRLKEALEEELTDAAKDLACFQMLYDVYEYTIGMIEELEKHETHGKEIQNSGILSHVIPVNHKKPIHDVIVGVELNLKHLQDQIKSLPPEVTNAAKKDLVEQTIKWAASREVQGIPNGDVDHYCNNVLEILLFGQTKESVDRGQEFKSTTEQTPKFMNQMKEQMNRGEELVKEFAQHLKKKAELRNKRQTEKLRQGTLCLAKGDPKLMKALWKRFPILEKYAPEAMDKACFQMLYDVYDYTIGMIEELEKHETHGKEIQNSGILKDLIPVHKKIPEINVILGVELNLKHLQDQIKSLPPEVTDAAKKDLVEQTIKWAASREAQGIPYGRVDHYCKNVLEILLFGAPKELPSEDRSLGTRFTTEHVPKLMDQLKEEMDLWEKVEEFAQHLKKKAELRNKRQTEDLRQGTLRLANGDETLRDVLGKQGYVSDEAMEIALFQMLYDEYDYTIAMIEELEKHETHGKQIQNSGILKDMIPVDHTIPENDVILGIRSNLKHLQDQIKSLLPEVTNAAEKDLVEQTIKWAASREAQGIPYGCVDHYCKNVLEILLFGAPKELPSEDRSLGTRFTTEQVAKLMDQMKKQMHLGEKQAKEFARHSEKKAKLRNKRQTEDLRQGALRIAKDDPRLRDVLEEQGYIPDETMEIESLPMLYNVYVYSMGMIGELDKHETHGKQIPVNQEKPIQDVIVGIELNLECLQHQMKSLPSEVTNAAKKDLVEQTIKWAASREAQGIPYGYVDHYCKNVLEILLFGEPKGLPSVDGAPNIKITTEQVDGALYQMAVQRHLGKKQDEKFYQDSTKKTELRTKRQIEDLRQGARRLAKGDKKLKKALKEELKDAAKDLASFQMLYNMYDYTIGMIEELEKPEKHGIQFQNSGILIRGKKKISENEVIVGIGLSLKYLQNQKKSLPPEVTNAAKKDLVEQTIKWAASREAQGTPYGDVDHYCKNVLEILLFGQTKESVDRGQEFKSTTEQTPKFMNQMKEQMNRGEELVKEFTQHLKKKVELRNKRQTENLRQGALRIAKDDPRLRDVLEEQGYIPDEAMEIDNPQEISGLDETQRLSGPQQAQIQGGNHVPQDDGYSGQIQVKDYNEPQQAQSQIELHRTIQAYFQMLYNVYDYTIGMIEELEKHETHGKQIQNSGILSHVIPVNHTKNRHEVIGGIELELKCLQAQMKSLPPEVTNAARKDLVMQTIRWAASREAKDIPYGHVDHYCKSVLETLLYGVPKELPKVDRAQEINLTTDQVNEAMHQMAVQRHLGDKQDEEFARDPTKKAKLRYKRQADDLRAGALRLAENDPSLRHALDEQRYVPDVSMDMS